MNPVIEALGKSKEFDKSKDVPKDDDCEEEEVEEGVKVSKAATSAATELQRVLRSGDGKSIALAMKNLIRECK